MKRVMFCSSLNKRLVVLVQNISINLKLFSTESGGILKAGQTLRAGHRTEDRDQEL